MALSSSMLVATAHAESCATVADNGVCLEDGSSPLVPGQSITVGGQPVGPISVTVPSYTVGGDVVVPSVAVSTPVSVCYVLGCLPAGSPVVATPTITVPVPNVTVGGNTVTVPGVTVPGQTVTTPAVGAPAVTIHNHTPQWAGCVVLEFGFDLGYWLSKPLAYNPPSAASALASCGSPLG